MKKLTLMAASVLAIAAAGANAKNFDGMYAGVRAEYNWDMQETDTIIGTLKFKPKGMGGSILFGYMNDLGNDMVIGTEIIAGYQNAKSKKEITRAPITIKGTYNNKLNFGADFLAGYKVMPELLGYGRLGLHIHQSEFQAELTEGVDTETFKNKSTYTPNVHVGVGAKYAIDENFAVDAGYTFAYDLMDKEYKRNDDTIKLDKSPSHKIHVGVSYQF